VRILHVAHSFLPRQGGVELYVDSLARHQAGPHCVGVLSPEPGVRESEIGRRAGESHAFTVFAIPGGAGLQRFRDSYSDRSSLRQAAEVLARFEPDLVHVHHLMNLSLALLPRARGAGARVVMTLHDYWLQCANGGQRWHPELGLCERLDARRCAACTVTLTGPALTLRRALERRRAAHTSVAPAGGLRGAPASSLAQAVGRGLRGAARAAGLGGAGRIARRWSAVREALTSVDLFLSPSEFVRQSFVDFGIEASRIRVLPNGVDRARFTRRRDWPDRARRFVYLGSLVPHKGVATLVEAFDRMPEGAELTIFGDPETHPGYARALRRRARHPGIQFAGPVPHPRVPEVLGAADCLVSPSIWYENHPASVLESFASGVPVIASAIGGQEELLRNGGGLAVRAGDVGELDRAMKTLATRPGLLRRLAAEIPEVPGDEEHLDQLERIYQSLPPREADPAPPAPVGRIDTSGPPAHRNPPG
jgi:glycosyltransferase involved in cell wall biosynthesis